MDRRRRQLPARPIVLIVDGHDDTRKLYATGLSALGFETIPVADAAEAYDEAWEMRPDIIVTELPARGHDGWNFLQRLKNEPRTRHIPVVALTIYSQRSVRERAAHDGFAAFIPKPCQMEELANGLRRVLDGTVHADARP